MPMLPLITLTTALAICRPDQEPAKLVRQLASERFEEREVAERALREMGPKALAALRKAMKDPDAEVARRARRTERAIRVAWRGELAAACRKAGWRGDSEHPVWLRYKRLVGGDEEARRLFVAMVREAHLLEALDEADTGPERAEFYYARELERVAYEELGKRVDRWERIVGTMGRLASYPKNSQAAAVFFLGSYPGTGSPRGDAAVDEKKARGKLPFVAEEAAINPSWHGSHGWRPLQKVFALWLGNRRHPATLECGLAAAVTWEVRDAVPVARRAAADRFLPATTRAAALVLLGLYGGRADGRLCEPLLSDRTLLLEAAPRQRRGEVQVRDAALAAAVALAGSDPARHGLPALAELRSALMPHLAREHFRDQRRLLTIPGLYEPEARSLLPLPAGFATATARQAIHDRARAWLKARQR